MKTFHGVWKGNARSFNGNLRVKLRFDVWRTPEGEIRGYYHCAPINGWCINNIDFGTVFGRDTDPNFMVKLLDQGWCNFYGGFTDITAEGRYNCYSSGQARTAGVWKLRKVPDELPTCGWGCRGSRDPAWSAKAWTKPEASPTPQ